jgi:general stress protein 26
MSTLTLADVSKTISGIEFAMLSTRAPNGFLAARPMSNNHDVEYNGDNYFFAFDQSHTVRDIERDPKIGLSFVGSKSLLGKPPTFVTIEAQAELIRDKAQFQQHWNSGIEKYASEGVDTPGLVLIKAHAVRIHYWQGNNEQELAV